MDVAVNVFVVARVIPEPLPTVRLLALDLALDEHPPRAVEHRDPLREDCFESCARVLHPVSFAIPFDRTHPCRGARAL
jgi:hypothetical protein